MLLLSLLLLLPGACGYLVREKRKRDDFILAASSARVDLFGERTVSIWITLALPYGLTMRSSAGHGRRRGDTV
jgi:hypothetical protein